MNTMRYVKDLKHCIRINVAPNFNTDYIYNLYRYVRIQSRVHDTHTRITITAIIRVWFESYNNFTLYKPCHIWT